jgi:hypothetical protein
MIKGNSKILIRNLRKMKEQEQQKQALDLSIVMRSTLERKEAEYKLACEWFKTVYDSNSTDEEVAEQDKVCYGLNEQIKLLRYLLGEYCA